MSNITRDSHYVPQAMQRRWSTDGSTIWAYRLLVSHPAVPEWVQRSIRGLAFQRDLYTTFAGTEEDDEFERWIGKEYEDPGLAAIDKLVSGSRLSPSDWRRLARFVAAQDVRTPLNYIESVRRWHNDIPSMLENTIQDAIARLEKARSEGKHLEPALMSEPNPFAKSIHVKIEPPTEPDSDQAAISAEVSVGRDLWIASMRHLLTGVAETLCSHRWSVAEPHGDDVWPLTDHPVVRLNYYSPGHYDFRGGWGNQGSEIMMPVSPRHLLYVQVGKKTENRFTFSAAHTNLVRGFLVGRAHRWIFAPTSLPWIGEHRPREINRERFLDEEKAWATWHEGLSDSESKRGEQEGSQEPEQ